jgi:hypothetical protein
MRRTRIVTELEPLLENQIGHAFNDVQRVLEPFTHGFGLAVIAPGFFAFAVGDLDIIPPNISDVHFQFVGDVEDFAFQAPPPQCDIQIVGSEIRIDSSMAFDMRFRRKFTLSANGSGEASGFLVGSLGVGFPIPSLAIFSFTTVDLRAIGPTFVGAVSSNLHYRGGLHGSLAEPSLTIDEADVILGLSLRSISCAVRRCRRESAGSAVRAHPMPVLRASSELLRRSVTCRLPLTTWPTR